MEIFMTTLCIIFLIMQYVLKKQYSIKCTKGELTFSAMGSFFALLFFVMVTKQMRLVPDVLPYSVAFAVSYSLCNVASVIALKIGSLAITTLIMSYSLVIPTFYGLVFWNEKTNLLQYAGIVFLLVSLYLIRAKDKDETQKKGSFKWILYLGIGFFTNGMCSVIQNMQQRRFQGVHNGNFMIMALLISTVLLASFAVLFENKDVIVAIQKGVLLAAANGISNGALNLFVMLTLATMAASVFFPVLSAGQIVLTFILSIIIFKEKFIPRQIVGFLFGIAALILLNL